MSSIKEGPTATQQEQTSHQSQVAQRVSPEPELPPEKRKLVLQLPHISLQINGWPT